MFTAIDIEAPAAPRGSIVRSLYTHYYQGLN